MKMSEIWLGICHAVVLVLIGGCFWMAGLFFHKVWKHVNEHPVGVTAMYQYERHINLTLGDTVMMDYKGRDQKIVVPNSDGSTWTYTPAPKVKK